MRTGITVAIFLGGLALAAALGGYLWWQLGDVEISGHGLIALAAGAVVSLLLGGGLMALVFYSSRRGHDERAQGREEQAGPAATPPLVYAGLKDNHGHKTWQT